MSVRQDRFTFFGVLVAVVIVVLGYLQLARIYPVAGHDGDAAADAGETEQQQDRPGATTREGEAQP